MIQGYYGRDVLELDSLQYSRSILDLFSNFTPFHVGRQQLFRDNTQYILLPNLLVMAEAFCI